MYDLSICVPSRNEEWLAETVKDLLSNIEGNTEIIVVLDGAPSVSPLPTDPRLKVLENKESIGQRAATNQAVRESSAKYIMKVDAHCAFDKGFDVKMLEMIKGHDNWTVAPLMRNLHVFDWKCPNGHTRYQGLSGVCQECGLETHKKLVWVAKNSPKSVSFCFDSTPHFQYNGEWTKTDQFHKEFEMYGGSTSSMSLQGSCFMLTREKYWELDICGEEFGSWGSQGIEVACKTWLTGGAVMVNHNTWYAHLFRTKGGDFGFPYHLSSSQISKAKNKARELFFEGKLPNAIHPLSWLVEKFWPVKGWDEEDLKKLKITESGNKCGIIYYTDNLLAPAIAEPVRDSIKASGLPIVSATLKKMDFGEKNIHFPSLKRGYEAYNKQILAALEHSKSDYVFFCEHDVLYHPSHFEFIPPRNDVFYYNQNVWFLRTSDGHALHYDVSQLSGLCVNRLVAIEHWKERVEMIKAEGFSRNMGFEPMTHHRIKWKKVWGSDTWMSPQPNIDVKHGGNLTGQRWKKEEYRNQQLLKNWQEVENYRVPGWENDVELLQRLK